MAGVKLTGEELDRALGVLERTTHGAFFPRPFEFDALRQHWAKVRPTLEGVDLLSFKPESAHTAFAPKQRYAVRPVVLLDPVDEVLFTALTIRVARRIEAKRIPVTRDIVFSHRYSDARPGSLFAEKPSWVEFDEKAQVHAVGASFVATADIVDFYPRIYLHRLENAIDAMGAGSLEVRAMMKLLEEWSAGTSYGIPTGPVASSYLAEALLNEVDEYLDSYGVRFVRYVDDYRLFAMSEAGGLRALYRLGQRLQQSQRLSLNMAKTRVLPATKFRRTTRPEVELRELVINKVFNGDPYAEVDYDSLTPEQRRLIDSVDVKRILERALAGDVVDFRAVAFVLHVLTALRRPDLVSLVVGNLDRLAPVSEAVARFLSVFDLLKSEARAKLGGALIEYWKQAEFLPDHQLMWLLQPFTKAIEWNHASELRRIARDHSNPLVRRQAILALGHTADRSSLLDVKPRVTDAHAPPWERRAAMFACRALPDDERRAILSHFRTNTAWTPKECLLRAVALFAESTA